MPAVRDKYAEACFREEHEALRRCDEGNSHRSEVGDEAYVVACHGVAGVILLDLHIVHEGCDLHHGEERGVPPVAHEVRGQGDERRHDQEVVPRFHEGTRPEPGVEQCVEERGRPGM